MNEITGVLTKTWALVAEVAPWLLVGFGLAGLISVVLKRSFVERTLGRPGIGSVIKATLIGVPMPLCSCGVIPVAAAIRQHGASRGATASFLASTPQTGVDSIAATWGLLGPFLAWVRVIVAFVSGILAGLLVQVFGRDVPAEATAGTPARKGGCCGGGDDCCAGEDHEAHSHDAEHACCHSDDAHATHGKRGGNCCHGDAEALAHHAEHAHSGGGGECCHGNDRHAHSVHHGHKACCRGGGTAVAVAEAHAAHGEGHSHGQHSHAAEGESCHLEPAAGPGQSLLSKIAGGLRYGFVTLPQDMLISLVVGLTLAGLVGALVPAGFFSDLGVSGFWAYVAITLFALPLYVCSTGSIPFAYVLLQAGLSPGGVLVFLVAGPATNAATIATMRRYIGMRGLLAYIFAIAATAWTAGALIDAGLGKEAVLRHIHEHVMQPSLFQHAAGVALVVMLAHAAWKRWKPAAAR